MRRHSVGPAATRAASIALAIAAAVVLAFTALASYHGGKKPVAAPMRPVTPVPVSTIPGSVAVPPTQPARPRLSVSRTRAWLTLLRGRWARDRNNYFQFRADGTGQWVAYGRKLWSGKATPRGARIFDLTDPSGQDASYWRVKLLTGGKRLYFAGSQQTYRKA